MKKVMYGGGLLGITQGRPGGRSPKFIQIVANGSILGIPIILILWIIIIVLATIVLKKTAFGSLSQCLLEV